MIPRKTLVTSLPVVLGVLLLLAFWVPARHWQAAAQGQGPSLYLPLVTYQDSVRYWSYSDHCECVKYVVRTLFDEDSLLIPGTWISASQMADDHYWGTATANYAFRVQTARPSRSTRLRPHSLLRSLPRPGQPAP